MKYAIVTGGTKGIGRAISEKLLREGYYVIANYAYDDVTAMMFYNENHDYKDHIFLCKKKLSSYEDAVEFTNIIQDITKKVSVIVFNVGETDRSSLYDMTMESWNNVINTNVSVPFYIVQKLGHNIVDNEGRILFIGSVCGIYPHSLSISYGVSKAAVHQMAKELVKFFQDRKITVNVISPGFIDTPRQLSKSDEVRDRISSKIALRRFGTSQEVASLCYEVICNSYINGAVLQIDGGYCFE